MEQQGCAPIFGCLTDLRLADPRHVLKRALARASDKGLTFYTHSEIEFYLFTKNLKASQPPISVDHAGFFVDISRAVRAAISVARQ